MFKRKFSLVMLTMMFIMSSMSVNAANGKQYFWDVPSNYWAAIAISDLATRNVLDGFEDGSFRPEDTVTRAEWAKIMVTAAGLTATDDAARYSDTSNHWANRYINAANSYLSAYSDGMYRPDQAAVREDVTIAMVKLKGYDVNNVDYSYVTSFDDMGSISNSVKKYVAVAVEKGLITGFEDNTFRGQATLTRAEAATLLYRAFQQGSANKTPDTSSAMNSASGSSSDPKYTAGSTPSSNSNQEAETNSSVDGADNSEENAYSYTLDTLFRTSLTKPSKPLIDATYNWDVADDTIYYAIADGVHKFNIESKKDELLIALSEFDLSNNVYACKSFEIRSIYFAEKFEDHRDCLIICGEYGNTQIDYTSRWDVRPDEECFETFVYSEGELIPVDQTCNTRTLRESLVVNVTSNDSIYALNSLTPSFSLSSTVIDAYSLRELQSGFCSYDELAFQNTALPEYIVTRSRNDGSGIIWSIPNNEVTYTKFFSNVAGVGASASEAYFADKNTNEITVTDFSGKELRIINGDNCRYIDNRPLNFSEMLPVMRLTSNNSIIYYDKTSAAFKIISQK